MKGSATILDQITLTIKGKPIQYFVGQSAAHCFIKLNKHGQVYCEASTEGVDVL